MEINTKRIYFLAIFCFATALALLIFFMFSSYTIVLVLMFLMLWLSMIFRNEYWFNELYERYKK